jgi:RNA polymerase sigma-70 factor, ECF subfamily
MPPTAAPRVGQAGPPARAGATRPPLPLPRRHSPGESAPSAGSHDTRRHDAAEAAEAVQPEETGGAWALVKAAQEGDMVAFGDLFDRYYDVVFRYVLFRTGDRTLAEDLTQETFVRALRRISSVSYQGRDIGAWFVTIARNLIFDHVKSSRYRLEQTTSEIIELSPSTGGPEQEVLDGATNDELLRCVRKLNPDQQECIQLRFLQGMSVAETAEIMDRNEGAVKALQHRAVRRLAQLLPEGLR